MKRILLFILLFSFISITYSQNGEWIWEKQFMRYMFNISDINGEDFILGGTFLPDSNWNNPPLEPHFNVSGGLIGKYLDNGELNWYNLYGTQNEPGYCMIENISAVSSDIFYSVFYYYPPFEFNGDTIVYSSATAAPSSILCKNDLDGNILWSKVYQGDTIAQSNSNAIRTYNICIDTEESVYSGGYYEGSIDFFDTTLNTDYTTYNISHYVCKHDSSGTLIWFKDLMLYYGWKITSNELIDKVVIYGQCFMNSYIGQDTLSCDDGSFIGLLNSQTGQLENVNHFPGIMNESINDLSFLDVDNLGNYYFITKIINDTIINPAGDTIASIDEDFILWKTDAYGGYIWSKHYTGQHDQSVKQLRVSENNQIFLSLDCNASIISDEDTLLADINTGQGILVLDSAGNYINYIGAQPVSFNTLSFNFVGNDIVIYGENWYDSNYPNDFYDHFLARYHPYGVGIDEYPLNKSMIKIFPNPTSNNLNCESISEIKEVCIYTVTGQLMKQSIHNSSTVSLNLSELDSGYYIILIKTKSDIFKEKIAVLK